MENSATVVNSTVLRCSLSALIDLCGSRIPPSLNKHPNVQLVTVSQLPGFVDLYMTFLKRYK